jgi:lipoprotein-anchoring transpeptidase ErfK/SrfK
MNAGSEPVALNACRNICRRFSGTRFGTTARSETLTDWPAGGYVGIHGTDRPELLPGRVSHGCIRLRNEDILALEQLMPIGTPVRIT